MANPSIVGAIAAMAQEYLVGGWPTPLKSDAVRQLGLWNSQYDGKNKNVPNHQPDMILKSDWGDWSKLRAENDPMKYVLALPLRNWTSDVEDVPSHRRQAKFVVVGCWSRSEVWVCGGGDNLTVLLVQSCRHPAWLPYKHHCCLSYIVYMFFPSSRTKILKHPPKTPSCLPSFRSCCLSSGSLSALQSRLQELEAEDDAIVIFNLRYPKKELLRGLLYNISMALYGIIMHYNVATGYIDC